MIEKKNRTVAENAMARWQNAVSGACSGRYGKNTEKISKKTARLVRTNSFLTDRREAARTAACLKNVRKYMPVRIPQESRIRFSGNVEPATEKLDVNQLVLPGRRNVRPGIRIQDKKNVIIRLLML